jgi:hypothetical protein
MSLRLLGEASLVDDEGLVRQVPARRVARVAAEVVAFAPESLVDLVEGHRSEDAAHCGLPVF